MANFFIRISDIISANINDMVDRLEDPERMIKQIIREMEENIRTSKEGVIDAIASEKELARELKHHRQRSEDWKQKASDALKAGNEDLARSALGRKKDHDLIIQDLEKAWEAARNTSQGLKSQLRALENKLAEVRRKRGTLAARQRAAEARQQMGKSETCFRRGLQYENTFNRMEHRILEIEARTEAISELEDDASDLEKEIEQLAVDTEVESELADLKKKLQTT